MGRRAALQPLSADGNANGNGSDEAMGEKGQAAGGGGGGGVAAAPGGTDGDAAPAPAPAPTPAPAPAPAPRRGGSPMSAAETAMHAESRANSRSPISQVSEPSQYASPVLTSRFAATKRPQTGKGAAAQPHPGSNVQQRAHHRLPPQLQLHHHSQPRDDGPPPPAASPRRDQSSGPTSPALPSSLPDEARRPANKSGFFHFGKSASKGGSGQISNPTSPYLESREQVFSGGAEGFVAPSKSGDLSYAQDHSQKSTSHYPSQSELSLSSAGEHESAPIPSAGGKRSKSNPFGLLSRSKSHRDRDLAGTRAVPTGHLPPTPSRSEQHDSSSSLRTAPMAPERPYRDVMNSSPRNRSEDRAVRRDSSRDKERGALPSSSKENGSSFFSGLRSSSTKAADMISKGLFGKNSRSGSTTEKEPVVDDEHYVLKVMNLPLVEQTRTTRISKRLEDSRDKTEFWMPAFPWRAIDYLNYKGCDVEGLYRVPGSGPQIKKWQRKFDEQFDVNLFEEDSLYDINIIGSMLKAWLRELPDELFPKEAQDRIARKCSGTTKGVPQMLTDELSNLPPFNYYLLFAITCHLSLLLAHSEKNKMDYTNLCICFQPCMKIDAFCFKFLVTQWRDCWKGCRNEAKYIEEEYRLFDQPPPRGIAEPNGPAHSEEQSARQSSTLLESGKPSKSGNEDKSRPIHLSDSNGSLGSKASSNSTNVTTHSGRESLERTRDLRPLSPIKPLSPIGF